MRLKERYGSNLLGQPHFRLAFSDDLYEIRVGTFNEFYGNIFLRSYKGPKEVRKYNYIHARWLLEMWHEIKPTKELPKPDGYECIYVFEDSSGKSLQVNWRVIQFIIFNVLHPLDKVQMKQLYEENDIHLFQSDVKYFEDLYSNSMSAELSKFHFGETIILPGK